ncbi:polysaccharide pyruvyl transferase family protein [Polaribacter sp. AHE13PA]|uniref:polysaccharide pyruvyl transferase family protein n=1 Tax=Polaribacter sp. AHE13PA TaxID=2745562 RepID=UPI001C4F7420|nr:polysaccharide pyruvyl transferase family protein [Polaribacter sp. AHE13PA]QXP66976.1 polysaccharide pyruvyl transferase family protein [Polaribacter sp. AHE13PA]
MKKIGIITIVHVNNYGAELQAFALQHKLNKLGYNAELINYLFYKNPKFKPTKKSQPFIQLSLKQRVKEFVYPYFKTVKSLPYLKQKKLRDNKFAEFHKLYTKQTNEINTIDKLYNTKFDYDIYVVGSDQVWNPNTNINIEPYFLTFAPKDKLKVSYASSFGVNSIPLIHQEKYASLLGNLDKIGTREKTGVEIVKSISSKEATWVLDPTFLLNKSEWSEFEVSTDIKKPYLLMYVLTDSDYISNLANQIAKKHNLQIVRICKNAFVEDKSENVINIIDAGPREYLGLFAKASFVLTTSFHGTCFSVNFNIPFFTILKKNKTNNSRQIDLLADLGIKDRILFIEDKVSDDDLMSINFADVNVKLEKNRNNSLKFLTDSISE